MNSVQRSAPIDIQNGNISNHTLLSSSLRASREPRERHDTISRIKSEINSRKRTSSNSLSPNLSSPTPPTFIPDGTHEISQLDKYLLVEHVEGHNSGNVYRTVDVNTEREYICKVYDNSNYRKFVEPYTRLPDHPHINPIVDIVQGNTKAYVFFEPGIAQSRNTKNFQVENLHSHILNKKNLDEQSAAHIFKQIVEAVSHCHQHNIVVRDLKLRKFIFKKADRTEVMMESLDDARILQAPKQDRMHDSHGCPAYVSPEMVTCTIASNCPANSDVSGYSGKASDVWSLGVMLYTLLVGRYPFVESGSSALFCKIRRAMYTVPDKLSSQAQDLIHHLLQRDVSKRFKAHEILKHPWITKKGNCWDEPRFIMPLGFGGHNRTTLRQKQSINYQQVPDMYSNVSYDYGDEQLVPDSYVSEEDETMFDF